MDREGGRFKGFLGFLVALGEAATTSPFLIAMVPWINFYEVAIVVSNLFTGAVAWDETVSSLLEYQVEYELEVRPSLWRYINCLLCLPKSDSQAIQ